jgi:single-strand DNA-binding protein
MRGLNKATLIGNLGADPDSKTFADGMVASLSVATTEKWRDKVTGETKERTDWHRVVLRNGLAETAVKYLRKGSRVYVEGAIRQRKYTPTDGIERTVTEIIIGAQGTLMMLDPPNGDRPPSAAPESAPKPSTKTPPAAPYGGGYPAQYDDDIPF